MQILAEILSDYSTREHTLTKLVRTAECVKMPAGEIKLILLQIGRKTDNDRVEEQCVNIPCSNQVTREEKW